MNNLNTGGIKFSTAYTICKRVVRMNIVLASVYGDGETITSLLFIKGTIIMYYMQYVKANSLYISYMVISKQRVRCVLIKKIMHKGEI